MTCDAHALIGPATHTGDAIDWIADCDQPAGHDGPHGGPLNHDIELAGGPGRTLPRFQWLENDRRNYHGDYPGVCAGPSACILPKRHHGNHAA